MQFQNNTGTNINRPHFKVALASYILIGYLHFYGHINLLSCYSKYDGVVIFYIYLKFYIYSKKIERHNHNENRKVQVTVLWSIWINMWKLGERHIKIPHTGDSESLDVCGQQHQYQTIQKIRKKQIIRKIRCIASGVRCHLSPLICH